MANIFSGAYRPPLPTSSIRTQHHRIARMAAVGMRNFEIAVRTRYSPGRVSQLLASPAMQELVAHYRTRVDEAFDRHADEYTELATSNMHRAEALISDRLDEAETEGGAPIPIKDLISISRDAADRFGYGKKSMVYNPGTDFAAAMEKALARCAIEAEKADV